jgi:hypothetical protein
VEDLELAAELSVVEHGSLLMEVVPAAVQPPQAGKTPALAGGNTRRAGGWLESGQVTAGRAGLAGVVVREIRSMPRP